ncbi:hypothetical protein [Mucilaginibacter sp. UR6-11]|uniref:hypothetical protein n=1 Tax=Mucilaginibacter sp. UR6-11 TaxID=1435644 RepID=UPI001E3AF303|nr:hypothetical protein [Mucilaginibacter sp. UR6-11]MCC8426368.1 hypothetical protein [Mucilaginibacter sp. UR6-11]
MVQINTRVLSCMPVNVIWFADRPSLSNCLLNYYKQSSYCGPVTGYYREPFFTKVININTEVSVFEAEFDRNTAYEIRRALKDGVETSVETNLPYFITFYNLFASSKQLPGLNSSFYKYESNIVITKATYKDEDIVMHAYLVDDDLKRVRLLYSASLFRVEKATQSRAVIGRANRLLHFKDMCHFKENGYKTYDLGGYAAGTTDEALLKINQFKDSFGGTLVQESDFLPIAARLYTFFNKILKHGAFKNLYKPV